MGKLGEIFVEISTDQHKLVGGLEEARLQVNEFGESIKGAMEMAVLGMSIAKVTEFLKECVTEAANLESAIARNKTIFGESTEEVSKFAEAMHEKFGSSVVAINRTAFSFGTIFKQLGKGEETTAKLSLAMTQLADDVAARRGMGMQEVGEIFQHSLMGMQRGLHQLGIDLSDNEIAAAGLKLGFGGVVSEMSEQEKQMSTLMVLMAKFKDEAGAHEKKLGTYTSEVQRLTGAYEELKETIGKLVLPSVVEALTGVNKTIEEAKAGNLNNVAKTLLSFLDPFGGASGTATARALNPGALTPAVAAPHAFVGPPAPTAEELARLLSKTPLNPNAAYGGFGAFGMMGNFGINMTAGLQKGELDFQIRQQEKRLHDWSGGHVMDTAGFMRTAQEKLLEKRDEVGEKQLAELKAMRTTLDKISNAKPITPLGVRLTGRE